MDLIECLKKEFKEKYDVDKELYEAYKKALEEYEEVNDKYINMNNELGNQLFDLKRKVQRVEQEKSEYENKLDFDKVEEKEKELSNIRKEINKAEKRKEIVLKAEKVADTNGELKEKKFELRRALNNLKENTDSKKDKAFEDFENRKTQYNYQVDEEINKMLFPLIELSNDIESVRMKIKRER